MRNRKWTVVVGITMLMMLSVALSGCGGKNNPTSDTSSMAKDTSKETTTAATDGTKSSGSNKSVTITLGSATKVIAGSLYDVWAKAFMKSNPNVTIEYWEGADHDAYKNKLRLNAQTKTLPDIFWQNLPTDGLPLIEAGATLDLTQYLQGDKEWQSYFYDTALEPATINGRIWGIPYQTTIEGWFYNKQMFDKYNLQIPKTFDDFVNAVKVFKQNGITPIAFGAKDTWATWQFQYFLKRYGFYNMRDDILAKKNKFNNPELLKGFEKLKVLHDAGAFALNASSTSNTQAEELFIAGKSPIYGTGSWDAGKLEKAAFAKDIVFDWGPTFADGVADQNDAVKDFHTVFMVGLGAKDKMDTVIKFLKFVTSPEGADLMVKTDGSIPASKVDLSKMQLGPLTKQLFDKLGDSNKGFVQLELTMPADFYSPYWDALVGTSLGILSPSEALDKLDAWNNKR